MLKETLIDMLLDEGIVKIKDKDEKPFTLKSGKKSRLFFDVKEASLNPNILHVIITKVYELEILQNYTKKDDKIGSVAIGGVPIATALSYKSRIPQIIIRPEEHKTGTESKIIGDCQGCNILLIEDVTTSGGSLINAVNNMREHGGTCDECIVMIDRQEGAEELCAQNDIALHPILTKSDFGIEE